MEVLKIIIIAICCIEIIFQFVVMFSPKLRIKMLEQKNFANNIRMIQAGKKFINCKSCGKIIDENDKYCKYCGTKQ